LSDNPQPDPAVDARLRAVVAVLAGYIAGCLATVAVFFAAGVLFGGGEMPLSQIFRMLVASFGFVLVLALPGFIVMRGGLYLARRTDWISFVVAGGLNGIAAVAAMRVYDRMSAAGPSVTSPWDLYLWLVGLGIVAGFACWAAERFVVQQFRLR
jgi:hypothetical protein